MIRSGLANVQKAGYLGYPHERDSTPRNDVERPFVSVGDGTVLQKSDFSDPLANPITVPAPVMYNDIFAKRTTADERLYVLRQIQQGLKNIQTGILGKDSKQVPQLPLPQPGAIIPTPPARTPNDPAFPTDPSAPVAEPPTQIPDLVGESPITPEDDVDLEMEEEAQDVVANPPAAPTLNDQERAADEWLHMQHSPQWTQIEGRPFNTASSEFHSAGSASTDFRSAGSYRGPDSAGSYPTPSPRYPTLPPLYPDLAMTPTSAGHSFAPSTSARYQTSESAEVFQQISSAASELPPAYSSPSSDFGVNQALDVIHRELEGLPLDQQREGLLRLSLEQRQNIGQAIINNPNHPITRERIIQIEIPLFAPPPSYLSAGTTRSYSTMTPSPLSIATTISSNGVGPRMRSAAPRTADSRMSVPMSVDSPQTTRQGMRGPRPPPIDTQMPAAAAPRSPTNYTRRGRPQVLGDVERLIQHGLRPRSRRNYYESPQS